MLHLEGDDEHQEEDHVYDPVDDDILHWYQ